MLDHNFFMKIQSRYSRHEQYRNLLVCLLPFPQTYQWCGRSSKIFSSGKQQLWHYMDTVVVGMFFSIEIQVARASTVSSTHNGGTEGHLDHYSQPSFDKRNLPFSLKFGVWMFWGTGETLVLARRHLDGQQSSYWPSSGEHEEEQSWTIPGVLSVCSDGAQIVPATPLKILPS